MQDMTITYKPPESGSTPPPWREENAKVMWELERHRIQPTPEELVVVDRCALAALAHKRSEAPPASAYEILGRTVRTPRRRTELLILVRRKVQLAEIHESHEPANGREEVA